jgi:hypothetical protein
MNSQKACSGHLEWPFAQYDHCFCVTGQRAQLLVQMRGHDGGGCHTNHGADMGHHSCVGATSLRARINPVGRPQRVSGPTRARSSRSLTPVLATGHACGGGNPTRYANQSCEAGRRGNAEGAPPQAESVLKSWWKTRKVVLGHMTHACMHAKRSGGGGEDFSPTPKKAPKHTVLNPLPRHNVREPKQMEERIIPLQATEGSQAEGQSARTRCSGVLTIIRKRGAMAIVRLCGQMRPR